MANPSIHLELEQGMAVTQGGMVSALRWLYLAVGGTLLVMLGGIYAWSIFVVPLGADFGWSRSETSLTFSLCMAMSCFGCLSAGFLSRKYSPRFITCCCGVLMGAGYVLASQVHSLPVLYLAYGILVGFGFGIGYNMIQSTVLKWFPDKLGLISGLLMMGFGFGALLLSTVGNRTIAIFGWRDTFLGIGLLFGVTVVLGSLFMKIPAAGVVFPESGAGKKKGGADVATADMVRRTSFWLYFAWAAGLGAGGLMVIGHAVPIALEQGSSAQNAALFAGLISIFNGLGRLLHGFSFDRKGAKFVMVSISAGFIAAALLLLFALNAGSLVMVAVGFVVAGVSYGGIFSTNGAVISSFYGLRNYSMNFSIMYFFMLFSSFGGPYLAGLLKSLTGSYVPMMIAMLAFGGFGLLMSLLIKKF